MPSPRYVFSAGDDVVEAGLRAIRTELGIVSDFAADVERAASDRASRPPASPATGARRDHRDLPFITIDPPGSMDLDQAYVAERTTRGYRVFYAIADVAAFVAPGSVIEREALARGLTLYSPDTRAPLYPRGLSEGAASLLPQDDRPALVWTLEVDRDGALGEARIEASTVRSRERLSYVEAQARLDAGTANEALELLREVGLARIDQEAARGAVSLSLPEQELVPIGDRYALGFRATLPVERWNAQISLMTGIAAARIMLDGGVGLLRTLPRPTDATVDRLRRAARALGIRWPRDMDYATRIRSLDDADPAHATLMHQAARLFRGAGYLAFDGTVTAKSEHAAIAANYAHVTAPLRRVGDRYANEIVLALCNGHAVPEHVRATLPELPGVLGRAQQRQGALDRAVADLGEALVLESRVGQCFEGSVIDVDARRAVVELVDPAVVARLEPRGLALGEVVQLRLVRVERAQRAVHFEVVAQNAR